MSFYEEMAALVAELAESDMFADAVITRKGVAAYDSATKRTIPASASTINCRGFLQEVRKWGDNGALFHKTVAFLDAEPKQGDVITIGSETHRVEEVIAIAPNGSAIFYQAVLL